MDTHSDIPPDAIDRARRDAVNFFGLGYLGWTLEGRILFMDDAAFNLLDLERKYAGPGDAIGVRLDKALRESTRSDLLVQLKQHSCVRGYEWRLQLANGEERWLFEDARLAVPSGPMAKYVTVPYIESALRDITMRKRKQAIQSADQNKYQTIVETMHEGYYETDLEGRLTFFNRPLANILGEPEETLLGANMAKRLQNDGFRRRMRGTYDALCKGESDMLVDWRLQRGDGSIVTLEVSINLMTGSAGTSCGFHGLVRDVTDRVHAEKAFRVAEARYNDLFEQANDIIYTHNLDGYFTSLNKTGEIITGYSREEAYSLRVYDIVAPEYRDKAIEMTGRRLREQEVGRYELDIIAKDGRRLTVEINARIIIQDGKSVGVQGIARDVTERHRAEEQRRRLERQLLHTQKLEGLGVLAGGIAHDFNNLLVGVMGNASLAMRRLPKNTPAAPYLKRIENAAQRAAELTNQMLAYSGRGAFVVRPLHVARVARETVELARAGIPKKIQFHFDFQEKLPLILGDLSQMHQVLMNLITNAAEAIGDEVGAITVGAQQVELDAESFNKVFFYASPTPGAYVCLFVSDTGCGMSEEEKSRIFDPFYSTKFTGRGLGLAALLGIVRGHKGAVSVYSELGQGTTFKLFFPAAPADVVADKDAASRKTEQDAALRRWKTSGLALVADDEEAVRLFAGEVLERQGMTVLSAGDGKEAIALYDQHKAELRVALVDLMMPFVNGQEVMQHIQRTRPDLPVVISSGYTEHEILDRFRENQPAHFIQKPYRTLDLVRALKKVLDVNETTPQP